MLRPGSPPSCAARVSTSTSSCRTTRGTDLAGSATRPIAVPDWAGPATVRVGEHAVAGELHLVATRGIDRSHPYLRPDGTGWPDNAGRFLAFSQRDRGAGA